MVVETLGDWDDGDGIISEMDVIAEIDRIVEDMLADYPGARFESSTVGNTTGLGPSLDPQCALDSERNPSFQIISPQEKGWFIEAKYLVWAFDILSHGWWHLVPFEVKKPISVFGLARMAVEWDTARKANPGLRANLAFGARCYKVLFGRICVWDEAMFCGWRESKRSDIGFGSLSIVEPPVENTKEPSYASAALIDVLESWPVSPLHSTKFTDNMNRWRIRYKHKINCGSPEEYGYPPSAVAAFISSGEFETLVIKAFGDLGMPVEQVPKELRRCVRKEQIRERVAGLTAAGVSDLSLIEAMMSDSPPSHLMSISGNRFQIVKETETVLQIPPRYLVWAYDVLNHGWWGAVPETIFSPMLTLFGLAQRAWEWETGGSRIYTLSASCYNCGERVRLHSPIQNCERCEEPWSLQIFWEWLRSRHFSTIYDQFRNVNLSRDSGGLYTDVSEMIAAVGFAVPSGNKGPALEPSEQEMDSFARMNCRPSLAERFRQWLARTRKRKCSGKGIDRWDYERLIVHRISSHLTLVTPSVGCNSATDSSNGHRQQQ
ncbi:hypothetical protein GNI_087830 [Gregarina niphandrodes]|uniref:Uncharacterized protein n=1 Tax=Gregarina niphandrodes TaxID=110365 RepID=A0A023B612_GRENI|nr:hypothetical protein GNI_087830 [Gregarina niphandrodes]EZG62746.1 hypothetical protein GNI_087830 [Gregarina niphandrodes]|eukprot:XP_011130725.1 hypothetical protein GNI_087830 [Gregarina niphandrodes]